MLKLLPQENSREWTTNMTVLQRRLPKPASLPHYVNKCTLYFLEFCPAVVELYCYTM